MGKWAYPFVTGKGPPFNESPTHFQKHIEGQIVSSCSLHFQEFYIFDPPKRTCETYPPKGYNFTPPNSQGPYIQPHEPHTRQPPMKHRAWLDWLPAKQQMDPLAGSNCFNLKHNAPHLGAGAF